MMGKSKISSGSIVLSGRQTMIVLQKCEDVIVACPFVYEGEPIHRSDVALEWHELVDAGLSRLDVRCRAIPCRRSVCSVTRIGQVAPEIVHRVSAKAGREQQQRNVETLARQGTGKRVRPRHVPVRAVWLEGGMMSRRETALRAI